MRKKLFRLAAMLLVVLLSCAPVLAEDEHCSWELEEGMLVVSVRTVSQNALEWTASLSESDMLELISDGFEADEMQVASANENGTWVTVWQPVEEAAGIVEIHLICCANGSDAPTENHVL